MKNTFDAPAQRARMTRWGIGITLAGFAAGGVFAAVTLPGSSAPTASAGTAATANANNAELNTLLSASTATGAPAASLGQRRNLPLRQLRRGGGYYGSITFGGGTLSFERGTIESVSRTNMVVRAPDGTTMTWQLVADTVVRDRGPASVSTLSDGQLVFVGGPVTGGAKDARLIVIRTAATGSPAPSTSPSASPTTATGTSMS